MKRVELQVDLDFGLLGYQTCSVSASASRMMTGEISIHIDGVLFEVPTKVAQVSITADCLPLIPQDTLKKIEGRLLSEYLSSVHPHGDSVGL